jgi:hypothetical protein
MTRCADGDRGRRYGQHEVLGDVSSWADQPAAQPACFATVARVADALTRNSIRGNLQAHSAARAPGGAATGVGLPVTAGADKDDVLVATRQAAGSAGAAEVSASWEPDLAPPWSSASLGG